MVLLLAATLLAASPRGSTTTLRAQLDVGGLVGASWYVPAGRERVESALTNVRGAVFGPGTLDAFALAYALPVMGPWLTAQHVDDWQDRALLATSGVLQLIGLTVGATRWLADAPEHDAGPLLSVSPIAGGRLGLSVRLTGF